jgi:hypothetical protein
MVINHNGIGTCSTVVVVPWKLQDFPNNTSYVCDCTQQNTKTKQSWDGSYNFFGIIKIIDILIFL